MARAVVIGLGTVSAVHLAAIAKLPGVELVGTANHDYQKLLDEVRPEVAHICTPHDTHADIVVECLERGVNVLLEKPVAHTVAAAERVIEAAAGRPSLKVGVCFQNRYNAAAVAAKDALVRMGKQSGSAYRQVSPGKQSSSAYQGLPPSAQSSSEHSYASATGKQSSSAYRELPPSAQSSSEHLDASATASATGTANTNAGTNATATVMWHRDAHYYAAAPWRGQMARSGGGVLINQAIHTLDLLEWLLGDVTRITGHTGHYGDVDGIDVEDTAHARLMHAGGAQSLLFATTTHAVDSPVTIEIETPESTLLIRDGLTITHRDGRVEHVAERRATSGKSYWGASHELLIADFYRTLHDPAPFWIGPAEGSRSLRLIDQLYRQ